jgi:hypothetical protein
MKPMAYSNTVQYRESQDTNNEFLSRKHLQIKNEIITHNFFPKTKNILGNPFTSLVELTAIRIIKYEE